MKKILVSLKSRIPDADTSLYLVGAFLVAGGIEINHSSIIVLGAFAVVGAVLEAIGSR